MLATRLAGRLVVPTGRDARLSRANVRLPAAAQVEACRPFALASSAALKERFARLIHRRSRLWPTFGRRRLRRQSQPDLV